MGTSIIFVKATLSGAGTDVFDQPANVAGMSSNGPTPDGLLACCNKQIQAFLVWLGQRPVAFFPFVECNARFGGEQSLCMLMPAMPVLLAFTQSLAIETPTLTVIAWEFEVCIPCFV